MPGTHTQITRKALLAIGLTVALVGPVCAEFGKPRIPDTFGLAGHDATGGNGAQWSASLERGEQANEIVLRLSVQLAADHYVYPTTFANGSLMKFTVAKTQGLEPIGEAFVPEHEPKIENDPDLKKLVERYYDGISWTRTFRLIPGTDPAKASATGKVIYQVCNKQGCYPGLEYAFDARLVEVAAGGDTPIQRATTEPSRPLSHYDQIVGPADDQTVRSRWTVVIAPQQATPGGIVTISVQAEVEPGWHVYPINLPASEEGGSLPTLIGLTELGGLVPTQDPIIVPKVIRYESSAGDGKVDQFHEGTMIWKRSFLVPLDAAGELALAGIIGWQTCTVKTCILPTGFEFSGTLKIADEILAAPIPITIGKTLKPSEVGNALEDLLSVNFGGQGTTQEKDLAAEPSEFLVPRIARAIARGGNARAALDTEDDSDVEDANGETGLTRMPLLMFVGTAVVFGFAALLTPCVFPMIPITVSFFQKQAEKEHHRPLSMAAVYCLGIIGAFTVLGMVMSILFGASALPELANTVVFNLCLAALLIFFALNLLGMFEIRMPSWLLTYTASKESKGGFVGVVFMALTFTLTSFTCTFAFAGALLVMAEAGNWVRPVIGLMAFSAAFSLPFFFLALFPSLLKKLPKSGGWMNVAKVLMGLLELGAAIKFLGNADQRWNGQPAVFDFHLMVAIWAVISIGAALYLFGFFRLPHDVATENIGVVRFITAMSLMGFAMYLGTGLFGARKPQGLIWKNVEAFANSTFDLSSDRTGPVVKHGKLTYSLDFEKALEIAIEENKPLFLDFTGENCTNCRKMENGPMSDAEIEARLGRFVRIQLFTDTVPLGDRTEAERLKEFNQSLQKNWFGSITLPSYVVIPPSKAVLKNRSLILSRFVGYDPDHAKFARFLDRGWSKWQKAQANRGSQIVDSR
jgi:thiol:disulfide interchange protein DsbD